MTSVLAPVADDLPSVSLVAECVKPHHKQHCNLRKRAGSRWQVGTACRGTDSVLKVLEHLGPSSGWKFNHGFSCERDKDKQTWARQNFPSVPMICQDVCELHTGRAFDVAASEVIYDPVVDSFVAGFVSKSVFLPKQHK